MQVTVLETVCNFIGNKKNADNNRNRRQNTKKKIKESQKKDNIYETLRHL